MQRLRWLPGFEVGVEEIDRDHRSLFSLVQQVYDAIDRAEWDDCRRLVDQFIAASLAHFDHEEAFLERVGFPDSDEHKRYHRSLLTKAEELKRICDREIDSRKIQDCYEETVAFLLDDIVRGDNAFKSFVQERGLPGSGE